MKPEVGKAGGQKRCLLSRSQCSRPEGQLTFAQPLWMVAIFSCMSAPNTAWVFFCWLPSGIPPTWHFFRVVGYRDRQEKSECFKYSQVFYLSLISLKKGGRRGEEVVRDNLAQLAETWSVCREASTGNLPKVKTGTPGDRPQRQLWTLSHAAWVCDPVTQKEGSQQVQGYRARMDGLYPV